MSRKRTNSGKRPKLSEKQSENNIKRKNPLSTIVENEPSLVTPHHRSLPKTHYKNDQYGKIKHNQSSKKSIDCENNRKRKSSPGKSSSGKKHGRSKDYDSPSKDHEDLQYLLIEPSGKSTKRNQNPDIDALLNAAKQLLRNNQPKEAIEVLQKAREKQQCYEADYLLGVCFLITEQYLNACTLFKHLMKLSKKPKRNMYLLLSVCYKKMDDFANTQKILNQCLQKYPKFYEAYIYRGKLYIKTKRFREANTDFQIAVELHPEKQIGYVGQGDCHRSSEDYEGAIHCYNIALKIEPTPSVLLRKAICLLELQNYDLALIDINNILDSDPQNSQAMYFKGLIYNKKKNFNEAIICYEQAIKFNTNKKAVTRSIYEIAKIKIELRDYYEAFYTLSRAQYLDIDIKSLQKFKTFTDGVTSLMKKNFDKGIEILDELVKQHTLTKFLKPLFLSAKAYGLMYLERFEDARSDLVRIEREFSLDTPNMYNKYICEGILSCNTDKYEQALAYFSKAEKTRPSRLEPNFYKAVALIRFSSKLIPKEMVDKKQEYLQSAMKTISKVDKIPENNPSLCLIRGLLKFSLGDVESSIVDFDTSIHDCSPPKAVSFYLKGLALATLGRIDEAAHEFNNASAHDEKHEYPEIYLNRAKCTLLRGQANKAFCDLQTYMTYRPSSPDIHIWAGHLLFCIGAYQDAAKAYSNINNIQKNPKVLLERAKCYIAYSDVSSAVQDLKYILDVQPDPRIKFDYSATKALRLCSNGPELFPEALDIFKDAKKQSPQYGKIFRQSDYKFYKGVLYFYIGHYQKVLIFQIKAIRNFDKAEKQKRAELSSHSLMDESEELQFEKLNFDGNGTFNVYEYYYNLALCHIMNGNLAKALKCLKSISQRNIGIDRIRHEIQVFTQFIQNEMKTALQGLKSNDFFNQEKQTKDEEEQTEFMPFPFENRFCSNFPDVYLPLSAIIRTRLYFCLPEVTKPDITPRLDDKLLDEVDMRWIDIKPEAPWIRRTDQGVVFTDEVVGYDIQLPKSQSDNSNEDDQDSHQEQEPQDEDANGSNRKSDNVLNRAVYEYEQEEEQPNRQAIKDMLMLGRDVEERLARICNKK